MLRTQDRQSSHRPDEDLLLRPNVSTHFFNKWIDIVLSVVSIVQGFAFANLAQRLPDITEYFLRTGDWILPAYWIVAFSILLRVFQTYIVAALDYEDWDVSFSDVFLIFVVGSIEYLIFSSLKLSGFDPIVFHRRLLYLSGLGLLGYGAALSKLRPRQFAYISLFENERTLQRANIAVSAITISISALVVWFHNPALFLSSAILVSLAMIWSIWFSLKRTISLRVKISRLLPEGPSEIVERDEVVTCSILSATLADVQDVASMLASEFAYVYEALFETSSTLTHELVRKLLEANGGYHNLGVRSFFVAVEPHKHEIVGIMLLSPPEKYGFRELKATTRFTLTLLRYLGLPRVIRVIQNFSFLATIVPIGAAGEMNVSYIAVVSEHRRKAVASSLLRFAIEYGSNQGASSLLAEVRETNEAGKMLFRSNGFTEVAMMKSASDLLLGRGPRLLFKYEIEPKGEVLVSA
jgi:ribosomal protein S18 acetylase RimI-like enzyme